MHNTKLPLGKYAKDPRLQIVQIGGHDAVRTNRYTIIQGETLLELWDPDEPNAIYPQHTEKTLARALAFALGDPQKVGPVGISDWLHTDGRVYSHDPATTGMRRAERLRIGDIVDFPHLAAFEITGPAVLIPDSIGRYTMTYPVHRLHGGAASFPFRDNDLVPVRFAR
jgi:hypothetical protein